MSQGNDFANYSATSDGSTGSEDVWFVAVASDDIKQMNVDQLDEAFRLGIITGETAVWTEGMEAWAPLGQVADLDAESETSGSVPAASHQHSDYPQHSGHQHSREEHSGYQQSSQQRSEPVEASRPAAFGSVTLQSPQHSFAPGPNSFGPGPNSVAPVSASYAPHLAQSTGPVALNVDEDMPAMHHGRRFRPERWALAAAALVAVGVVGYNNMFSSSVASAGTQASAPTVLAARPYDGADGVEPGEKLNAKAAATEESPSKAAHEPSISPVAAAPAVAVPSTKASALIAKDEVDPESSPGSSRSSKGSDKESLKGSFSKAFNKKATAASKAGKAKPRKATSRATESACHADQQEARRRPQPVGIRSVERLAPLSRSCPSVPGASCPSMSRARRRPLGGVGVSRSRRLRVRAAGGPRRARPRAWPLNA